MSEPCRLCGRTVERDDVELPTGEAVCDRCTSHVEPRRGFLTGPELADYQYHGLRGFDV